MMKFLILVLLNIALVHYGDALNCFATDVQVLQATQRLSHPVRNCDSYIDDMKNKFKIAGINKEDPLRCYTVNVNTHAPSQDFAIKGCVPDGRCDTIVKPLIEAEAKKRSLSIKDMKCFECVDNECNSFL